MNLNGRLARLQKQANEQTIPTWDELVDVCIGVTGEPPAHIMDAGHRDANGQQLPGDYEMLKNWIEPFVALIHDAWDRTYPRWEECPFWAEKRAERAANEQV